MTATKIDRTLGTLGERGFLKKVLPGIKHFQSSRYLVPPGDDAAVLNSSGRPVLSIDALTEGTHFKSAWSARCAKTGGFLLARGLGWKLLGSSLSDLAAMGDTSDRWAMITLGAPSSLKISFAKEFQAGLLDTARRYRCALAGGDTIRSRSLTMVAAVGGSLIGRRALTRSGARPGDLVCVAGTIGDAAFGLRILSGKIRMSASDARYFVRRFFQHEPMFKAGALLARERGVTALIDLSDSLRDTIEIISDASHVGVRVCVDDLPVSKRYARLFPNDASLLTGGEDYSLLFTLRSSALRRLRKKLNFRVIGRVTQVSEGISYFLKGRRIQPRASFEHFK